MTRAYSGLSASMSVSCSITEMEEGMRRANVDGGGIASNKADELEVIMSGLQSFLTKNALVGWLPISILNVAPHAPIQGLEVLGEM